MKNFIRLIAIIILITASVLTAKESLSVAVDGSKVVINQKDISSNCASLFKASISISNNYIVITQMDTAKEKARCNCDFDMAYNLSSLAPGNYSVDVYREYQTKYGYSSNWKEFIGKLEFTVKIPVKTVLSAFDYEQSPCKGTSDYKIKSQSIPGGFQVYPNPAVSNVTIKYELENDADVTLRMYNMLGKEVLVLNKKSVDAGVHDITLNAGELPAGMYIGKLTSSNGFEKSFKLVWSK